MMPHFASDVHLAVATEEVIDDHSSDWRPFYIILTDELRRTIEWEELWFSNCYIWGTFTLKPQTETCLNSRILLVNSEDLSNLPFCPMHTCLNSRILLVNSKIFQSILFVPWTHA
jgi:hypothetical protein